MDHPPSVIRVQRRIEADHPAFEGHFPDAPLLPGVVLLAEVLEAVISAGWAAPVQIASAKFLAPVRPGSTIVIELAVPPGEQNATFDVRCGDACVATGRLTRETAQ
jgi:3-hydroxymyristoyl/3-hydroxydecanoyl-(acyl carrier protein) dehydratase